MKALALLSISIFLSSAAAAADDPGGWTAAKWGMTVDQARAAMPAARPLAKPELIDGVPCQLAVAGVEIGGSTFISYICFTDGRLSAVHLQAWRPSQAGFTSAELLLAEKYGHPLSRQEESNRTSQWTFPTTVIDLRYVNLAPKIRFESLWLTYRQPSKSAI